MMTRKDFEALAEAIAGSWMNGPDAAKAAYRIGKVCQASNGNFDASRFYDACGRGGRIGLFSDRDLADAALDDGDVRAADAFAEREAEGVK